MKNSVSFLGAGLVAALAFTSCQKEEVTTGGPLTPATKSPTYHEQVARFIAEKQQEKVLGNGAIFIDQTGSYDAFGVSKDLVFDYSTFTIVSGEICFFGAEYGANDFWRVNPDGTVSVHLVSNQADAAYTNFGTMEDYSGVGHTNFNFTGNLVTFPVPFPPFSLTFIVPDATQSAFSVHGQSNVLLNGTTGPNRKLKMKWLGNPGGQGSATLTFN